jgi:hypothetical protein
MARDEVLRGLATIDKPAVDDLLKDARKRLPRSQAARLRAEVEAQAEKRSSRRFKAKVVAS